MKVNQQQSFLLTSDLPNPNPDKKDISKVCLIDQDIIMMIIIFAMLIYYIFNFSHEDSNIINHKHYQFLEIPVDQTKKYEKNYGLPEKLSWFVFQDLNQSLILQAIKKKQLERNPLMFTIEEKKARRKSKQVYRESQISYFGQKSKIVQLQNTKHIIHNLGDSSIEADIQQLNKREEYIYKLRYQIDKYPHELSICIVIYSRDYQNPYSQYEPLLRSIFNQRYSNYRVIFIADQMHPEVLLSLYKYIKKQHYQKKIQVVEMNPKKGYARSVLKVLKSFCKFSKIGAIVNGNDQLITQYVFSIYNAVYQSKGAKVAYSNYYQYLPQEHQIYLGSSNRYSNQQIEALSYRQSMPKVGPLLTFDMALVPYIDQTYLKYDENIYYQWQDLSFKALSYQFLELSCGKIQYIFQYQYLMKRAALERREFIRQIHMKPRRCYEYEDIQ